MNKENKKDVTKKEEKIKVKFVKAMIHLSRSYREGETAGFPPKTAKLIIDQEFAKKV